MKIHIFEHRAHSMHLALRPVFYIFNVHICPVHSFLYKRKCILNAQALPAVVNIKCAVTDVIQFGRTAGAIH